MGYYIIYIMAGWVADKSWLLIMVLQIDSENSATGDLDTLEFQRLRKRLLYKNLLREGDILLIEDDNFKPIKWSLVEILIQDSLQEKMVKHPLQQCSLNTKTFIHPLKRLHNLEVTNHLFCSYLGEKLPFPPETR